MSATLEARFRLTRGGFQLDAALSIPAAGITALFGPSGCGKTTLLRAMAGLERAPGGYLRVGDQVWQDEASCLPVHRRPLGYVFQETSLFSHLSVERNLLYGFSRVPAGERRIEPAEAIALLGLSGLLARDPASLSGGERQRVAIARALLTSPRLLLLDEPLAALDAAARAEILPYLEALGQQLELPVIYVSHQSDEVARLADTLALMEGGTIRAVGPLPELLTRLDLPLSHAREAGAVIEARVKGEDPAFGLTHLEFAGGRFELASAGLSPGSTVRLRVHARDVSLTLERQAGTSIRNIFEARVVELAEEPPARMTVRLDCAGVPLLSRITRASASELGLEEGKLVFAQVKSVALL
ncbi:MAG: molybdenum ABC transporter ATP-binding protein [Deltaproteobacteria bacterium]|nr:molybdenum ABC transporter ATP-binding protein [Deltaproteobacteria bacterium]